MILQQETSKLGKKMARHFMMGNWIDSRMCLHLMESYQNIMRLHNSSIKHFMIKSFTHSIKIISINILYIKPFPKQT